MANQSKRLLTNSLLNLTPFVNQLLMGLVLVPFVVRHLGDSTYGIWALISGVLSYSTLLTLSLNSGVTRWIPMLLVKEDTEGVNRVVSTVLAAFTVSTGVLAVAVGSLIWAFPFVFSIPPELVAESRTAVFLVGVGFVGLVQLSVFSGVLSGLERYDLFAGCELARAFLQVCGVIVVLVTDGGLVALALAYGFANVVRSLLSLVLARRAFPELRPRRALASWALFREMLGYSVNTFLYTVQEVLARQMGLILIGAMLTTAAVTEYAMPMVLVSVLMVLIAQLTNVMKPAVSRLDAGDEQAAVRTMYLGSSKLTLMLAVPIGAVLVLYGDRVLQLWLREAYLPSEAAILSVLACATVFRCWLRPAFIVVVGMGRHRVFGRVAMAQVLLASSAAFAGLWLFGWTTYEVAWAFAIPEITIATLVLIPYSSRTIGVPVTVLLRQGVGPALLSSAPALVALVVLEPWLRSFESYAFVGALAAVGSLVPAGAWLLGLTPAEKRMLLRAARLA